MNDTVSTLISLVIVVFVLAGVWKVFEKAGEPGWKALIPFYNIYTEYKLFWGNGWLFLLAFVPVVNVVVAIMLRHKISKAFGHGVGYTIGLIVLPYIFYPILGFGQSELVER